MTRFNARRTVALIAVVLLATAGCSGDDGGTGEDGNPIPGVTTPSSLPDASAGAGTLIVDGVTYDFDVTECEFGSIDGAQRGVPIVLFSLAGAGKGLDDEPFDVSIRRVFAKGDTDTFTDTVVLHQPAFNFLVQADRSESDGLVIDLRDPTATASLLKLGDKHVTGSGTFGSRGSTADDPTLPGTLSAGCP